MKVYSISNSVYQHEKDAPIISSSGKKMLSQADTYFPNNINNLDSTSFKGNSLSLDKRFWHVFKNLSEYFKESDEIVSQIIQFVGTAAIAPFAILVSPSRGEAKKLPKKEQKEKKLFQALRQPVSAVLAFSIMFPLTTTTKKLMNKSAFEKRSEWFNKNVLNINGKDIEFGQLITSKSYLTKKIKKQLKKTGVTEESISQIKGFSDKLDLDALRKEFKENIARDYRDSGIELSAEKLEQKAGSKRKFRKFVSEKIAGIMRNKELDAKVEEFAKRTDLKIEDLDLVTDKYKKLMKNDYKEEFAAIKKEHKLSIFDTLLDSWGISSKKMKSYKDASDKLAKEKGLAYLKEHEPELFRDPSKRLRNYVENLDKEAQRIFKRKTDLIPLGINIFGFAVSCLVLNWLHPKFAAFVDRTRQKNAERKAQKAEVARWV